jgi:hypothetical protein
MEVIEIRIRPQLHAGIDKNMRVVFFENGMDATVRFGRFDSQERSPFLLVNGDW